MSFLSSRGVFAVVLTVFAGSLSPACADGIGSLVEVGKSVDAVKKELAQETERYNGVKSALRSGALQRGIPRQEVLGRYGEPVVMNEDHATGRERWVYKPAGSSFFEGETITIFFDRDGNLDEVKGSE